MRINYNVSAMLSNNALANNDNMLAKSLERLSSGLKINHAKDGPSGLAMAKRMNAQIEGLAVANQNASDGISLIEVADGAMTEISDMLQRMNELAVKSANGILSDSDRQTIQDEISQLKDEIERISGTTEFNGQKILNGEFDLKGYVLTDPANPQLDIKVSSYSKDVPVKVYSIDSLTIDKEYVNGTETGEYIANVSLGGEFPVGAKTEMNGKLLTIKGANGFEMTLDLTGIDYTALPATYNDFKIDATGLGAMKLQVGANEDQYLSVEIPKVSLREMGIEDIDASTEEGALHAIDCIGRAVNYVSDIRGRLGAYQNRLESTTRSLDITSQNMTAAYSRIMDVDMAEEMTEYTTNQVLTQAGTSMLAQANERPSQVLQLLQ